MILSALRLPHPVCLHVGPDFYVSEFVLYDHFYGNRDLSLCLFYPRPSVTPPHPAGVGQRRAAGARTAPPRRGWQRFTEQPVKLLMLNVQMFAPK